MFAFLSNTPIGKVWIYRLLFVSVCVFTVTDFSAEDNNLPIVFVAKDDVSGPCFRRNFSSSLAMGDQTTQQPGVAGRAQVSHFVYDAVLQQTVFNQSLFRCEYVQ